MKIKEKSENLISRPLFYPWRDIFSARTQVFVGEKLVKFRKEIPFSALWQNQGKNGISAKTEKPKTNRGLLKSKKFSFCHPSFINPSPQLSRCIPVISASTLDEPETAPETTPKTAPETTPDRRRNRRRKRRRKQGANNAGTSSPPRQSGNFGPEAI